MGWLLAKTVNGPMKPEYVSDSTQSGKQYLTLC